MTPRPSSGLITCRDVRSSRVTEYAAVARAASKSTSLSVVRAYTVQATNLARAAGSVLLEVYEVP